MNKCGTCRKWKQNYSASFFSHRHKATSFGECGEARLVLFDDGNVRKEDMLVISHGEYSTDLMTRIDFGCVLWEEKRDE